MKLDFKKEKEKKMLLAGTDLVDLEESPTCEFEISSSGFIDVLPSLRITNTDHRLVQTERLCTGPEN